MPVCWCCWHSLGLRGIDGKKWGSAALPNPSIPGSNRVFRLSWPPGWAGLPFSSIWYATHHRAHFSTTDRSPANLPTETGIYYRLNVFSGRNPGAFYRMGVYIMGLMSQEFTALGLEQNEFAAFVQTFFSVLCLAGGRYGASDDRAGTDFGPMQKAEISARQDTHSSPAKPNLTAARSMASDTPMPDPYWSGCRWPYSRVCSVGSWSRWGSSRRCPAHCFAPGSPAPISVQPSP